ncbi:hypothetical protein J1N35_025575, partial [Gossypium stocksii]
MVKGRGRLLTDLYDLVPTERVKVRRNSHGQPVGSEARVLASYLGILARNPNMFPINYESWHHMPDSNKNQALDNIKDRFTLEVSDDYIKKALDKKWRDNKSTLKNQYFKKDISLEEKLRNVPLGILRYQWEDTDRERVGKSSRQKQKFTHTAGSRSFARVAEAEERLKEKKAEYEAVASTDNSVNHEDIDNRIITEVLGPESSQQYMPSGSQAQAEVQRLKDQIAQMQASTVEQIAEVQRKYEELQQQLIVDAVEREAAAAAREAKQCR